MTKKILTTMIVAMTFIMIMTFVTVSTVSAVPFDVTLQGPDVTRDSYVRITWAEGNNYGSSSRIDVAERWQRVGTWGLLDFELADYLDGQPVENAEIALYHYATTHLLAGSTEIQLRPLTKAWTEDGVTAITTDGTTEWNTGASVVGGGSAYISSRDEEGNWLNFTDEILGSATVAGNDHENSTVNSWLTFSGQTLDDYVNEVIDGTREHYGFLVYVNLSQWAYDALYSLYSSNYATDPTLQPKMTFTVIPEPASMVLLGLGGLLLLRRRRV